MSSGRGHRGKENLISSGGASAPVSSLRRKIMRANKRRDTGPELALRSELHRRGLRYRVDQPVRIGSERPVRPDVVFTRRKVAVFVDGCFWHGCPVHGTLPKKTNRGYWTEKIARNQERDRRNKLLLESDGWIVIRAWGHEEPTAVADRVERALARRRLDKA